MRWSGSLPIDADTHVPAEEPSTASTAGSRTAKSRRNQAEAPNGKCGWPKAIIEFGDESRYIRASHRPREQVALHRMYSGRCDELLLFDGFDALGNDLQA